LIIYFSYSVQHSKLAKENKLVGYWILYYLVSVFRTFRYFLR